MTQTKYNVELIREVPNTVINALLAAQLELFPGSESNQSDNLFAFARTSDPEFFYQDTLFANNVLTLVFQYDKEAARWLSDLAKKTIDYNRLDLAVEALSLKLNKD